MTGVIKDSPLALVILFNISGASLKYDKGTLNIDSTSLGLD